MRGVKCTLGGLEKLLALAVYPDESERKKLSTHRQTGENQQLT
jgi:hypothetical protein